MAAAAAQLHYFQRQAPYEVDQLIHGLIINFTLIDLSSTVSQADIGRLEASHLVNPRQMS